MLKILRQCGVIPTVIQGQILAHNQTGVQRGILVGKLVVVSVANVLEDSKFFCGAGVVRKLKTLPYLTLN